MNDKQKIINITVSGPISSGKTEVMAVIENTLKEFYGSYARVTSYSLAVERKLNGNNLIKIAGETGQTFNVKNTIINMEEVNER